MRERYSPMIAMPTKAAAEHCGGSRGYLRTIDLILDTAKHIFPDKRAANLAVISKASQRSCEEWISGRSNLSADAVVNILRSEHGLQFLEALVGDARPAWWKTFKRRTNAANLERQIQELQKQLEDIRRVDVGGAD